MKYITIIIIVIIGIILLWQFNLQSIPIRIDTPRPNQIIESPLTIEGQAKGTWFFEGDFPVVLTDWDGRIIGEGFVTANPPVGGDSMTEEFVSFSGVLEFESSESMEYKNNGTLILRKDNPTGLPEHDDALEIPILFKSSLER